MLWDPDGEQNRGRSALFDPRAQTQGQGRPMGFAALTNGGFGGSGMATGMGAGMGIGAQKVEKEMESKAGTSVEDAIEL